MSSSQKNSARGVKGFFRRNVLDRLAEQSVPRYVASMTQANRFDYVNGKIRLYKRLNIVYLAILSVGFFILLAMEAWVMLLLYAATVLVTVSRVEQGCIGVCAVCAAVCVICGSSDWVMLLVFAAMAATSLFAAANSYKLRIAEKVDTAVPLFQRAVSGAEKTWDERTATFGGDKLSTAREPAAVERERTMMSESITSRADKAAPVGQTGLPQSPATDGAAQSAARETLNELADTVNSATDRIFEDDDDDQVKLKNFRVILYGVLILGIFPRMFWGQSVEDPFVGLYTLTLAATLFKKAAFHIPFVLVCFAIGTSSYTNVPQLVVYGILTLLGVLLVVVNHMIIDGGKAQPLPVKTVYSQGEKTANLAVDGDRQRFMNPVDEREMVMHRRTAPTDGISWNSNSFDAVEQMRNERLKDIGGEAAPSINLYPQRPEFDMPEETPPAPIFDVPADKPPFFGAPDAQNTEMPAIDLGGTAMGADITVNFEQQLIENADKNRGSAHGARLDGEEMGDIDIQQALAENKIDLTNISSADAYEQNGDSIASVNPQTAIADNKIDITNSPLAKRRGEATYHSEIDYHMDAASERNVMFSQKLFTNVQIDEGADISAASAVNTAKTPVVGGFADIEPSVPNYAVDITVEDGIPDLSPSRDIIAENGGFDYGAGAADGGIDYVDNSGFSHGVSGIREQDYAASGFAQTDSVVRAQKYSPSATSAVQADGASGLAETSGYSSSASGFVQADNDVRAQKYAPSAFGTAQTSGDSHAPAYAPITPLMPTYGADSKPAYAPITPLMPKYGGDETEAAEGIDTAKILFGHDGKQ